MSRPEVLSDDVIAAKLGYHPLWQREGNTILREFTAQNFVGVIGMVNAIAILAEAMDHHPDILIYGWNKMRVTLSTHDRGGLTELDFQLAKKIDDLKY